jgi:hypothetical protein
MNSRSYYRFVTEGKVKFGELKRGKSKRTKRTKKLNGYWELKN